MVYRRKVSLTPAQRSFIQFQVLYNGKDKGTPIRNFTRGDGKAKAMRFFRAEQRAGKDVSFWDTLDNSLSDSFSI